MDTPANDGTKRRIRLSGEQRRMLIREYIARHLRDVGRLPTQREVLRATGGKAAIVSETLRGIRESGISEDGAQEEFSGRNHPKSENDSGKRRLKREQRLKMMTRFVEQYIEDHGRLPTQRQVLSAAGGSARTAQQVLLHYRHQALAHSRTSSSCSDTDGGNVPVVVSGWRRQRMSRAEREELVRRYVDARLQQDGRLPTQRDVLANVGGGAAIVQGMLATYRARCETNATKEERSKDGLDVG
jgi:hypothetical protein